MNPITLSQFDDLLQQAGYDGCVHVLDMVVEVPAGIRAGQTAAHLVAWNNHKAEGVRLEVVGGWSVMGIRVRMRGSSQVVYGVGRADVNGRRFAEAGQTCGRCARPFVTAEVVSAYDCCLDTDACVAAARRLAEEQARQRAELAHQRQMLARQQARRDGQGAHRWMMAAAANGRQSFPADVWQRAHGDPAALEAAKAETRAAVKAMFAGDMQ